MWIYYDCRLKYYVKLLFCLPFFYYLELLSDQLWLIMISQLFLSCFSFSYIYCICTLQNCIVKLNFKCNYFYLFFMWIAVKKCKGCQSVLFLSMLCYLFCNLMCMVFKICFRKRKNARVLDLFFFPEEEQVAFDYYFLTALFSHFYWGCQCLQNLECVSLVVNG